MTPYRISIDSLSTSPTLIYMLKQSYNTIEAIIMVFNVKFAGLDVPNAEKILHPY